MNKQDLDSRVIAAGKLIGLLAESNGDITVDRSWFSHPVTQLETIGHRLNCLVAILNSTLTSRGENSPPVFADAGWYAIPNPDSGAPTPFHVITSKESETSGQMGLGVLASTPLHDLTLTPFVYAPLFTYTPDGAKLVITNNPCKVGLYITASDKFAIDGVVSFTGINIDADIYLADKTPGFTLEFVGLQGTNRPSTYHTLESLLDPTVDQWLSEIVTKGKGWLDQYVGPSITVGEILKASHFLREDDGGEYHLDLASLRGKSGTEIALTLLFAVLDSLSTLAVPLIALPGGGIYVEGRENADKSKDYGVRFAFNVPLTSSENTTTNDRSPKAPPDIDFCFGTWFANENKTDSWMEQVSGSERDPGLSLFFLNRDSQNKLRFSPGLELSSIGIKIRGNNDTPLFTVDGYTLKGAEIRTYLSPDNQWTNWTFACAARLDDIGVPLGSSFDTRATGETNPVARNLLASGDTSQPDKGGNAATDKTDPVNPTFSIEAAYINRNSAGRSDYLLQFYNADGSKTDRLWFPVQRQMGPLSCQKLGIQVDTSRKDDPRLTLIFDGGVKVSSLEIDLIDLLIGVPLKNLGTIEGYDLDLEGMSLYFNNGTVEISGGFLKNKEITTTHPFLTYDGDAILKFKQYSLSAFGSYGVMNDSQASLFIFAALTGPIGGPGFFYVTGIAAGFGYNRDLKIPGEPKDVLEFPLIALLPDPLAPTSDPPKPDKVLQDLGKCIPPKRNCYWLAAGVQFTSFEIVSGNLLLIIKFGGEFEIDVLGIARVKQPLEGPTYVKAELGLVATFNPGHGILTVKAALTANSYLIDPSCHLTGGFAFASWFEPNEHAGDFALTLGGYHPAFIIPDHYPKVDRLGINWVMSDRIFLRGEAYFALTPSAAMLGGRLDLEYRSGKLRAWAIAHVDMIIFWKPFYLEGSIGVSIGVSYRLDLLFIHTTLEVSLSVELEVWGPPTGGKIHVDWYIISFSIGFGANKNIDTAATMNWEKFQTMLPKSGTATGPETRDNAPVAMATSEDNPDGNAPEVAMLSINAGAGGLLATEGERWLIRPSIFSFTVQTVMPVKSVTLNGTERAIGSEVGVRPMGIRQLDATMDITIGREGTPFGTWSAESLDRNLPRALWGPPIARENLPKKPDDPLQCLVGLARIQLVPDTFHGTDEFDAKNLFDYLRLEIVTDTSPHYYRQFLGLDPSAVEPTTGGPSTVTTDDAIKKINDAVVVEKRRRLFDALGVLGTHAVSDGSLEHLAENPIGDLLGIPMQKTAA